jgi:hypothetical protein
VHLKSPSFFQDGEEHQYSLYYQDTLFIETNWFTVQDIWPKFHLTFKIFFSFIFIWPKSLSHLPQILLFSLMTSCQIICPKDDDIPPKTQDHFTSLPAELLLMIITFLNTGDIVALGHSCRHLLVIAEQERTKRQDIDRLLKRYVQDPHGFRRLMRDTGCIIVGHFARAFFTGEEPPKSEMELLIGNGDIHTCVKSWASFLGIDVMDVFSNSFANIPLLGRYRRQNHEVGRLLLSPKIVPRELMMTRGSLCAVINSSERNAFSSSSNSR